MTTDQLWAGLLLLTNKVKEYQGVIHHTIIQFGPEPEVHINRLPVPIPGTPMVLVILDAESIQDHALASVVRLEGFFAHMEKRKGLEKDEESFLCAYLPYCFLSVKADQLKRAIVITHFAQSLDGKATSFVDESRWSGNQQNRVHADRMRALSDSILIGSKTMSNDHPSLDVKLVHGSSPVCVVLCSKASQQQKMEIPTQNEVLVAGMYDALPEHDGSYLQFAPNEEGRINCQDLLAKLYERGIYTVCIEGGPFTVSEFIRQKQVDLIQLHFAPVIFGSGTNSFNFNAGSTVDKQPVREDVHFSNFNFLPLGNTYLFVGEPEMI